MITYKNNGKLVIKNDLGKELVFGYINIKYSWWAKFLVFLSNVGKNE